MFISPFYGGKYLANTVNSSTSILFADSPCWHCVFLTRTYPEIGQNYWHWFVILSGKSGAEISH